MLAKKVATNGLDWDQHLPYVLSAYRASVQESIQGTPFYLLYGWDPTLPSSLAMDEDPSCQQVDLCCTLLKYTTEVTVGSLGASSRVCAACSETSKVKF